MSVNNVVNNVNVNVTVNQTNNNTVSVDNNTNVAAETNTPAVDTFESVAANNQEYKTDFNKIREMWSEHDAKVESFRRLIEGLFNKQGEKAGITEGWERWRGNRNHPFASDMMVAIDAETRAAAQAEIEEGGYYSVDETAKRILNFAVALSGGDPSKVDLLEKAALQGFAQVEKMWGGELPEISRQTMEAVQRGFDEWRQTGSASAITLLQ
jgi:hypothetical protein